jgi:hypothetical protein
MVKEAPNFEEDPKMDEIRKRAANSHKKPPEGQEGDNYDEGEEGTVDSVENDPDASV